MDRKGLGLGNVARQGSAADQTSGLEALLKFFPHLLASDLQPLWKDREGG